MKIYAYITPSGRDRWIAANSKRAADSAARRRKWRAEFNGQEILRGYFKPAISHSELLASGVDLIV